jgi:hypothetical protein
MSLLIRPEPIRLMPREPTSAIHFDLGSSSTPVQPQAIRRAEERERIKGTLLDRRYRQIVDIRLGHIPARLPFPKAAIIDRLKENDRGSQNLQSQERLADLEAELALIQTELASQAVEIDRNIGPKTRRLNAIWTYLSLSAERFQLMTSQRIGRLNYNIGLFSRSDLPSQYIVDVGESTHWELAALTISSNAEVRRLVEEITGQSAEGVQREAFLQTKDSLRNIEVAYRDYARSLRKVTTVSDHVLEWRDALEYYVDLFSAEDLASFRRPRQISSSSIDPGILAHLSVGLRGVVAKLRRVLAVQHPDELANFEWFPRDDSFLTGFLQLELETT